MDTLVIMGAGQQGRNCKTIAEYNGFKPYAFIDDYAIGPVEGLPVYRHIKDVPDYQGRKYIVAFGDLSVRRRAISEAEAAGVEFVNLIHPTACIEEGARIGVGNYIYAFAIIYGSAKIGNHNIINSKALVATDAIVCDNCNICMGSNLCGDVYVGNDSYVGHNATIVSGGRIENNSYVKPGEVI